nr:reverse transcriptase domain-containing protein [Tanacetum cinerariifolium]
DQTSRYSANYNDMTAKQIDVIDMACEEYSQEVLGFSNVITSGNPTPYYDLIVSTTSLTLTPFENNDFLLEEVDKFLALEDDPTLPEELKICEAKFDKSSIDEPLEVKLKDLPPYFEYAFLEGDDKLPAIIAKYLNVEEKTALITVIKSHKRAIAWKLSNVKEDFEPVVQHQRIVNPKIHDVIKQEVLKLLNAGLTYPIFDSPWVSPVHCVPKKGGFTVVENEENELIPTIGHGLACLHQLLGGVETTSHLFFQCVLSKQIMRKVSSWWNVDYTDLSLYEEWRVWLVSIRIPNKLKSMMEGVFYGLWWSIWNFRNKLLFDNKTPKKALIFDNLVSLAFNWCKYRCKASFKWDD